MNTVLRRDAEYIARAAIKAVCPAEAVKRALEGKTFPGRVLLVSVGKAAWKMAETAVSLLSQVQGIVLTKYGHVEYPLPGIRCIEAGHPVPDENSFMGSRAVLDMTADLTAEDTVLFLLSGGGSALFEEPLITGEELQNITSQLLASGADIVEMNTIRKRLSGVKGGRFARHCAPAHVEQIVLSDILGDPLDMIASGPAAPDSSTCREALAIAEKYHLQMSPAAWDCLGQETPKSLENVSTKIIGSVRELAKAAAAACRELGYEPVILTDHLDCEARDAGRYMAKILRENCEYSIQEEESEDLKLKKDPKDLKQKYNPKDLKQKYNPKDLKQKYNPKDLKQ
ncbi:MAG: glycerate-2-kinase family protein, partial [Lachnospiraceae bacterium]|nr:glycerate-2-kinase family protein [Lachnospiraceae bacterium]